MRSAQECMFGEKPENIPRELRIMFGTFVLTHALEDRMEEFNISDPLTKPERQVLLHLGTPRRMGEMAGALNSLPSKVTSVADALEAKGLALRERDPDDRRAWRLRLTRTGAEARKNLIETTISKFREITGLNAAEIDQLARILDGVSGRIVGRGMPKGLEL